MTDCTPKPNGNFCPPASDWKNCKPWDFTKQSRLNCYIDSLTQQALSIAGAQINVFKLLGIHEQTKLIDLTGDGTPISGGNIPGFNATNAFNIFATEWRSRQSGALLISTGYIGYDFGVVKIPTGRQRYSIDANIRQHITALKIKQSANPLARVTKARVERSDNGVDWYGVSIVALPNDDVLNTIYFKNSVPSRFWRLRPITFAGGDCDTWGIQALQLYDYSITHISNIQDKVLLENRDRDYQEVAVQMKGYYDIPSRISDLSRFGIEDAPLTYNIKLNFSSCVAQLGRPVVVGDIIELPSEVQYTPSLQPVKRFLEVTDVSWDVSSYTPGWQPTLLMISAQPALASQETQSIYGDLANKHVDNSGLFSTNDGNNTMYQDISTVSQTIAAEAASQVPERGSEGSNTIREFTDDQKDLATKQGFPHLNKVGFNRTGLYVEDAMPQNNAPYTEGPELPDKTKAQDGAYHRLTYTGLAEDIPARLYKFFAKKNDWIYQETDRRGQYNSQSPRLDEFTTSRYKKFAQEIK